MYWRGFKLVNKLPEIGEYAIWYILTSDDLSNLSEDQKSEEVINRWIEPKSGDINCFYNISKGEWKKDVND